jgi:hypothetical protein
MRSQPILFLFLILFAGCQKDPIEQIQTNIVIQAMTSGQWKVTSFIKGSTNVTTDFANYKFQFKADKTVDAIVVSSGAVEKTGSWDANADAKTITSNFTSASATLTLLNGTWTITNNSMTFVEAKQTVNGEIWTLRLDKV